MSAVNPPFHFIGHGQKWTDVSALRAENAFYTNETGRAIVVAVTTINSGGNFSCNIYAVVDGVNKVIGAPHTYVPSAGGYRLSAFAIIPAGGVYMAQSSGGNIFNWMELR